MAKEIRREVVQEVSEALEEFQREEGSCKDTAKGVAGNIHNERFRQFWLKTLKPDAWTVKVIEEGYKLPFLTAPDRYCEETTNRPKRMFHISGKKFALYARKG